MSSWLAKNKLSGKNLSTFISTKIMTVKWSKVHQYLSALALWSWVGIVPQLEPFWFSPSRNWRTSKLVLLHNQYVLSFTNNFMKITAKSFTSVTTTEYEESLFTLLGWFWIGLLWWNFWGPPWAVCRYKIICYICLKRKKKKNLCTQSKHWVHHKQYCFHHWAHCKY